MKLIFILWELPQTIVGFVLSRFCKFERKYNDVGVYSARWLPSSVSFGEFVLVKTSGTELGARLGWFYLNIIKHEYGHSLQSRMLGPLYLLAVGVPSILRNLYDRLFHRRWTALARDGWYYGSYPENWADKLGGMKR